MKAAQHEPDLGAIGGCGRSAVVSIHQHEPFRYPGLCDKTGRQTKRRQVAQRNCFGPGVVRKQGVVAGRGIKLYHQRGHGPNWIVYAPDLVGPTSGQGMPLSTGWKHAAQLRCRCQPWGRRRWANLGSHVVDPLTPGAGLFQIVYPAPSVDNNTIGKADQGCLKAVIATTGTSCPPAVIRVTPPGSVRASMMRV